MLLPVLDQFQEMETLHCKLFAVQWLLFNNSVCDFLLIYLEYNVILIKFCEYFCGYCSGCILQELTFDNSIFLKKIC